MSRRILAAFLLLAPAILFGADNQWTLGQSTLTYRVSHPRGKGVCHAGQCVFLIAVPVKSFDSKDSNRDLHMLQVTRGAQFPMVAVRVAVSESELATATIHCDLEIQFAGQTAYYKQVPFQREARGNDVRITGTIPATLSDFKIDPPSLLTIPVKNDMPVHVDLTWHPS
jgi:hypothetical protein